MRASLSLSFFRARNGTEDGRLLGQGRVLGGSPIPPCHGRASILMDNLEAGPERRSHVSLRAPSSEDNSSHPQRVTWVRQTTVRSTASSWNTIPSLSSRSQTRFVLPCSQTASDRTRASSESDTVCVQCLYCDGARHDSATCRRATEPMRRAVGSAAGTTREGLMCGI